MEETPGEAIKRKRPPGWVIWLVGFAISIAVGLLIDHLTNKTLLAGMAKAGQDWIAAAGSTSPWAAAETYGHELDAAWNGRSGPGYDLDGSRSAGFWSPLVALFSTAGSLFSTGGLAALLQLALGALAVAVYNHSKSRGRTIFFDEMITNVLLGPVAIILAASVIGAILWAVLQGVSSTLQGVTQLATSSAGTCTVGGFCWYFGKKLTEKGIEHVVTPKF